MDLPQEIIYCDILNGDFSIFLIIYLFMWIHLQGRFVTPPHPLIYFYLYKYKLMDICFIIFFFSTSLYSGFARCSRLAFISLAQALESASLL